MKLVTYRINQNFKKQIYSKLINPYSLRFTIRIVGNKLIFHQSDIEFVEKVLEQNSLTFKTLK